jgi:hypothetical protein
VAGRRFGYHRRVTSEPFVPADFAVPDGLTASDFRLAPLGPQHNEADHAAWMGSIDHIRVTPGFAGSSWPREMSLEDNLRDLERHAQDFAGRRGFTYTMLSTGTDEVIGCVYIYPPRQSRPAVPHDQPRRTSPGWSVGASCRPKRRRAGKERSTPRNIPTK